MVKSNITHPLDWLCQNKKIERFTNHFTRKTAIPSVGFHKYLNPPSPLFRILPFFVLSFMYKIRVVPLGPAHIIVCFDLMLESQDV